MTEDPRRNIAPGQIRNELAEDLGKDYAQLYRTFREAMGEATKDYWLSCQACGQKKVYAAPDHKTRIEAGEKWVKIALGLKQAEPDDPTGLLEQTIRSLNAEQRQELVRWLTTKYPDSAQALDAALSQVRGRPTRVIRPSQREVG